MKNKLHAFTLQEMLIAMVVSSIAIGLAFLALSVFTKNMSLIQNNYQHKTTISLLEQQLYIDFHRYNMASLTESGFLLSNSIDSIEYDIDRDFVIRSKDTVYEGTIRLNTFFRGEETFKGNFDALKVSIIHKNDTTSIFVTKKEDLTLEMAQKWD